MSAPDPFALGGHAAGLSDEIIVDEESKAELALVVNEPVLGPLAHRLFEADELYGNTVDSGTLYEERAAVCRELGEQIAETPAQTMGGVAWRLANLIRELDGAYDLDPWALKALRRVYEDALRLAQMEPDGSREDPVVQLAAERHRLNAEGAQIVAWGGRLLPGDPGEAEYHAQATPIWNAIGDIEDKMMETVATTKAGLLAQVDLLGDDRLTRDDLPLVESLKAGITGLRLKA